MFCGQAIQCPQVSSWVQVTVTELERADRGPGQDQRRVRGRGVLMGAGRGDKRPNVRHRHRRERGDCVSLPDQQEEPVHEVYLIGGGNCKTLRKITQTFTG